MIGVTLGIKQLTTSCSKRARQPKVLSPQNQCLCAARWIPHGFNMFCDLGEAIKVTLLLEQEATEDEDEGDSEVAKRHRAILQRV